MAYGLPSRGQADWDDELNNSMEALRADVQSSSAVATVAASDAAYARNRADEVHTAVIGTADAATAGFVNDSASATAQALSATIEAEAVTAITAVGAGIDPTGVADSRAAIQAKIDSLPASGGTVFFPKGTYKITGNLTVADDLTRLVGSGDGTFLDFTDGGLVVDGSTTYTTEIGLHDLTIRRQGTAGPAVHLKGGGAGTGVAHFNASNVRVRASTGEGLLVQGSYIGSFTGCYWIACATGIKIIEDINGGDVYGNNLSFFGGETQGCAVAAYLDNPLGVNFYGHAFEGSTVSGVELPGGAYASGLYGCYFEANAGWDVKIGTTSNCLSMAIKGCLFLDGPTGKTNSIIAIRSRALGIEDTTFNGYGGPPVKIQEAAAGLVQGHVRNCWDGTGGDMVDLGGATLFNKSFLGYHGSTGIAKHLTGSASPDVASIAAQSQATFTITVTGAAVGDDATAHPNSMPETGLTWDAVVTASNTVTVRLTNVTAAAIDPVVRTWRARVWR